MPDTIPSPQCGDPARITERFWLDSTDGPVEHLKTGCLSKHWFTSRADTVQSEQVATPDRDLACCRADWTWCCQRSTEQRRSSAPEQDGWR
jgi:hypothetical protein